MFLGNYLIGLREGLEATLVVTILVAFLVKSNRKSMLLPVWLGVAAAVLLSVVFGAILQEAEDLLSFKQRELFEAITSILAVAFVTWMIFWMRRFSRRLAGDLRGKLEDAIKGGGFAVVVMAFLAVVREGLETALIFFAAAQNSTSSSVPLFGLIAGVATAVALGWLIYLGAIRINLSVFFRWSGALLILVAAGIFKYGIHDLQEADVVGGLNSIAFDISSFYDQSSWYGTLLAGMFNITATPTVLESVAWVAYAIPVLIVFLWPGKPIPAVAPPDPTPDRAVSETV